MDLIAGQYDANDSALRRTVERIKDALEPVGILAPASRASGRRPALTARHGAHIAPTEEPFLAINSRSLSTLFVLVRGVSGSDAAAQNSVSGELLIRGLWVRSPRGPPR
jgi:hypothetical protein